MSDIVERLRVTGEYGGPALCTEAADEIERLRAEVERLEANLAKQLLTGGYNNTIVEWKK